MNQPNCLFCGKPADHKCGDAYDCGACCSMRGLLAHDSPLVYKWLENRIRPELLRLRSAPAPRGCKPILTCICEVPED